MPITINGKKYNIPKGDYLIRSLIESGDLEKMDSGYKWSNKHFKKQISNIKHISRYLKYPLYRFFVNIFRNLRKR